MMRKMRITIRPTVHHKPRNDWTTLRVFLLSYTFWAVPNQLPEATLLSFVTNNSIQGINPYKNNK